MLKKLIRILNHTEEILLAYVSLGLGLLIVFEIIIRATGVTAFYWLEELGRYVLIFMVFSAVSLAVKHEKNPSMKALLTIIPAQAVHVIRGITNLFLGVFAAYIDYYAWLHIAHLSKVGMKTTTLWVPFYVPYAPIGVFCFFISLRFMLASVKEFQAFIKARSNNQDHRCDHE